MCVVTSTARKCAVVLGTSRRRTSRMKHTLKGAHWAPKHLQPYTWNKNTYKVERVPFIRPIWSSYVSHRCRTTWIILHLQLVYSKKAQMFSSLCVLLPGGWFRPGLQCTLEYSSCHRKCACHWRETLIAFAGWQQRRAQVCVWGPSACKWDLELRRHCLLVGNNWSAGSTSEVHLLSPSTVLDSLWVSDWFTVSNKWPAPDLEPSFLFTRTSRSWGGQTSIVFTLHCPPHSTTTLTHTHTLSSFIFVVAAPSFN